MPSAAVAYRSHFGTQTTHQESAHHANKELCTKRGTYNWDSRSAVWNRRVRPELPTPAPELHGTSMDAARVTHVVLGALVGACTTATRVVRAVSRTAVVIQASAVGAARAAAAGTA